MEERQHPVWWSTGLGVHTQLLSNQPGGGGNARKRILDTCLPLLYSKLWVVLVWLHVCSYDDDPHSGLKLNSASWILSPPLPFCVQAGSRDGGCRDPAVSVSIVLLLSSYLSLLLALHCVWLNVMMLGLGRDLVTPSCKRCWALVLVCLGSEHIRSLSIKPDGPQLERKILLNISRVQIWLLKAEVSAQPGSSQLRRVKH